MTIRGSVCERCRHLHVGGDAIAVGRFIGSGPIGYRANYPNSPTLPTREDAAQAMCNYRRAATLDEPPAVPAWLTFGAPVNVLCVPSNARPYVVPGHVREALPVNGTVWRAEVAYLDGGRWHVRRLTANADGPDPASFVSPAKHEPLLTPEHLVAL